MKLPSGKEGSGQGNKTECKKTPKNKKTDKQDHAACYRPYLTCPLQGSCCCPPPFQPVEDPAPFGTSRGRGCFTGSHFGGWGGGGVLLGLEHACCSQAPDGSAPCRSLRRARRPCCIAVSRAALFHTARGSRGVRRCGSALGTLILVRCKASARGPLRQVKLHEAQKRRLGLLT